MEVNFEALEQLSMADLIALYNTLNGNTEKGKEAIEMTDFIGEEIAKRINNIFIFD